MSCYIALAWGAGCYREPAATRLSLVALGLHKFTDRAELAVHVFFFITRRNVN